MGICDVYEEDYMHYYQRGDKRIEYQMIMESDISMLRMWLALVGTNNKMKVAVGQKFNTKCFAHAANDLPVRIVEEIKTYTCYGCGIGGTIVSLVTQICRVSEDDAIDILYSIVTNNINIDSLGEKNYNIAKEIFEKYSSKEVEEYAIAYSTISKAQTDILNERIHNYVAKYGKSDEVINRMSRRLCCSKEHINDILNIDKTLENQEPVLLSFEPNIFYANDAIGKDCDGNTIEEFRILWAIFRNDENIEDMKDEDPREYCAIIADDGKAYAISVYDQFNAKLIREREHIPDYEEIPTLIKPIASMENYECACGEEPIYYDWDRKELKQKLNNMLKENPFETKTIDEINSDIRKMKAKGINIDEISDGYHTIGEYKEGAVCDFMVMCHAYPDISWKSKKHYDEKNDPISNFNDDFIAGINTPAGPITKHIKMKYWDQLDVKEIDHAPKYDGYTKQDENERKKSLYKLRGKN